VDTYAIEPDGNRQTNRGPGPAGVHIVAGVHAGAVIPVSTHDTLLVGAGDDCDVILADPGVRAHHCMLSARGTKLAFRPIEDAVLVNGRRHPPGESVVVAVGGLAEVGNSVLEVVGPADLAKGSAQGGWRPGRGRRGVRATLLRQSRWGVAAVLAVAMACELHPVNPRTAMGAAQAPGGAAPSESQPEAVDWAGAAMAHDVAEVLRLSGIPGEAHYESNGAVAVHGHLGDPQAVARVVQSRAMREITGLKRVAVVNLDQPAVPDLGASDATWVVRAIPSNDPYVIATDGSRYYIGATLPRGGRLAGVQDGEILVDHDGQVEHVKVSGSRPGS
jgi:type III secretion protein D